MRSKMLCINVDHVEELDLSLNQVMCLYKIKYPSIKYNGLFSDFEKLESKKYIKIIIGAQGVSYVLRSKSDILLENMTSHYKIEQEESPKKITRRKANILIEENLQNFRNKWKGLSPGSMGAKKSCKEKLTRWIKENPEYSFEDILKAVDIYISSFNGNYKYLQRADYFVFKKDGREESSRLSAFIEEVNLNIPDKDWTATIN